MKLTEQAAGKSPWIIHYDCNSCNGCDIEILACLTPVYDAERFGVVNVGNPKHADILIVSGSVNYRSRRVLENIWREMPGPKVVIAVGACACTGGIFAECYNILGGVDKVLPVDIYVPGCSPRPEAILDAVVLATDMLKNKREELARRQAEHVRKLRAKDPKGGNNAG